MWTCNSWCWLRLLETIFLLPVHYQPEHHMRKIGFYLQGHSNWISVHTIKYDYFYYMFWTGDFFLGGDQLSLTVHVHKLKCLVKRLLCCIQGQGHSEGSELQWTYADWSVKLSMVMHHHQPEYHSEIYFCYVQGQRHNRFY